MKATARTTAASPQKDKGGNAREGRYLWLIVDNTTKAPKNKEAARLAKRVTQLMAEGRENEAFGACKRIIELEPEFSRAHVLWGAGLCEAKRYEEAMASCDRAIKLEPEFSRAHLLRGRVLLETERFGEAIASCNRAVALEPKYSVGHAALGEALLEAERYVEAIASCDLAIELDPNFTPAHLVRNDALEKIGLSKVDESNTVEYNYRMPSSEAISQVADAFNIPAERRDDLAKMIEDFAASALATTPRAKASPRLAGAATETTTRKRGPRVKPNPALPKTAPEIYRDRKPREELGGKKENIVQFIERVYAPWREILTRADLRRRDDTADKAIEHWIDHGKRLPEGLLLTEFELNTAKRAAKVRGARLRQEVSAPT